MTVTRTILISLCLLLSLGLSGQALAWDATSHRLSAYVAWDALAPEQRQIYSALLKKHPRFQSDFLDVMPANIMLADQDEQDRWVFGQAAIWPDLARSFQADDLIRYNRPTWHYIDGAWIRGDAHQGNVYVGVEPQPSIHGESTGPIEHEGDVSNVVQGIEFNLARLKHPLSSSSEKAIALSWVLHLVADIHQPLHSGALVSSTLFATGDRGGNGISTQSSNLHSRWDGALRNQPFDDTVRRMISFVRQTDLSSIDMSPDTWLQESRQILYEFAYPDEIKAAVLRSERRGTQMSAFALDDDYVSEMQTISEDRVTLAGIRLSIALDAALDH
ncbi:MAG: S1/P1 nuclease [Gammaproteobacteria bacterium]